MERKPHTPLPEDWRTCGPRYWTHVDVKGPDECWPWSASKQKSGHGQFTLGSKPEGTRGPFRAHRVGWALAQGSDPGESLVLHTCDNPPCQNPAHLFLGTHPDNMEDMRKKMRGHNSAKTHCPRGHEYTEENTYRASNGKYMVRRCKMCLADQQRIRHGNPTKHS